MGIPNPVPLQTPWSPVGYQVVEVAGETVPATLDRPPPRPPARRRDHAVDEHRAGGRRGRRAQAHRRRARRAVHGAGDRRPRDRRQGDPQRGHGPADLPVRAREALGRPRPDPQRGGGDPALRAALAAAGFAAGFTTPSRDMLARGATPPGATGKVFGFIYSGLDLGSAITPII